MAARAPADRLPFPIKALTPALHIVPANGSMRYEVVGPAEPITLPGGAGLGPMKDHLAPGSNGSASPFSIMRRRRSCALSRAT